MKILFLAVAAILLIATAEAKAWSPWPSTNLHYAPNGNFATGSYDLGPYGFNLADVESPSDFPLPSGVQGLVFLGLCNGADANFQSTVSAYAGQSGVYGFYLMDDPDPTGLYKTQCQPANLKAESDWIHANVPGTVTFIVDMSLCVSNTQPCYQLSGYPYYTPSNTDIDYFGIDPYPCQTQFHGCNYSIIGAYVSAANAVGILTSYIIPVYQAFGNYDGGDWTLPTATQTEEIFRTWAPLVPNPAFDYAYSWGVQEGDSAISNTPTLRGVYKQKNTN